MASKQKVVVVTGATSGVGRAIARRFGEDGASVGLLCRGPESLAATRHEVEEAGGRALEVPTDVSDADAVEAAARQVEEAFGPIDIWVNNAMTTVFSFFQDVTAEEFQRATDVTYHGTVWGTQAALRRMRARDAGAIVLVGSAMAYRGIPLQAPYCGAKHAIKGFFESLRCELRNQGSKVHLAMVQLPGLNTPQFDHCRSKMDGHPIPVPPIYEPEVAADAVHWIAHHRRRREVYVGIPTVYTVLGNKIAPWLAERYLARTAVSGQQTEQPPDRLNAEGNIFETADEDPGARGRYSDQAHSRSPQWFMSRHRLALLGGLASAAGAAALAARR